MKWHNWTYIIPLFLLAGCGITNQTTGTGQSVDPSPSLPVASSVADAEGLETVSSKDVPTQVEKMLGGAGHQNVDVEMYEFTNTRLADALISAKHNGADVHVILDATVSGNRKIASQLSQAGIPVEMMHVGSNGYTDIDHVKLLTVGKNLLMGSVNWGAETYRTTDLDVFLPGQAKTADALFEYDWKIGKHGTYVRADHLVNRDSMVRLYTDSQIEPAAVSAINSAKQSIRLYMFSFDDKSVREALAAAKKRGVQVSVLVDQHYERKVNSSTVRFLRNAGVTVQWASASNVLHAKDCVIDGKEVLFGSANYSNSGFKYNHEVLAIVNSTKVAQSVVSTLP